MPLFRFTSISLAMAATILAGTSLARTAADHSQIDEGRRIFFAKGCYQCHGAAGQGSIISGPALGPFSIPLDAMRHYVRNPAGVMPPYRTASLPDAEVQSIRAFLVTLPKPRNQATIPLLAPLARAVPGGDADTAGAARPATAAGSFLYGQHCAMCHGANLQGGIGPVLRDEGSKRSAAQIEQLLRAPPPGMPKLYPGTINDSAVAAIAAYVHGAADAKARP